MNHQEVIGVLLSITALSSYINYRFIKLPNSIGITLVTLLLIILFHIGGWYGWDLADFSNQLLHNIDFNATFMHGMLSFLLFAGSLHVNVMELAKHKALVALLATVSVGLSTFIVGWSVYGLTQAIGLELPFYYCFVFGALISPTDPIAVLGVLKRIKAPKSLEVKIAGEALFNDGMGIVLFFVMISIATGHHAKMEFWGIVGFFVRQCLGGIVFGATMGGFASILLRKVNDSQVAIIITLAIVTAGYILAENFAKVSGPISMSVAGLILGSYLKTSEMSKATLKNLDSFWELIDEVLNAILFVLIGLVSADIIFNMEIILVAIGSIVIAITARWISIAVPVACLNRFRKFNNEILMIMTWGGLRGGISIALALSVQGPYSNFLVAITYAVVIFSMVVQALTIAPLVTNMKNQKLQLSSQEISTTA